MLGTPKPLAPIERGRESASKAVTVAVRNRKIWRNRQKELWPTREK